MATAFVYDPPQPLAAFRRVGDNRDTYCIWIEGPMLRIDASGVFDLQIARSYATDIKRIVADVRHAGSKLRVVVDRIESRVLEPGVAQILIDTYRAVLRPGDRVALVVQTSMDKAPIRTVADREETQVFLSMSAAKTWVLAYD